MTTIPSQGIIRGQTVQRVRRTAGTYVDGLYVDGASSAPTNHQASVQIYDRFSNDSKVLTEGDRVQDWIEVYTLPGTFRQHDDFTGLLADLILYNGFTYEVKQVHYWKGAFLTHDRVWAVRIG